MKKFKPSDFEDSLRHTFENSVVSEQVKECKFCDFEHAVTKGRARWHCPNCDRDYSLEYVFYREAVQKDELLDKENK